MRRCLGLATLALLALVVAPGGALAQEAPDEAAPAPTDAPDAAETGSEDGPGFSRVIDDEETIFAVQRKAYLIKNKFEISVMYNTLMGDRFVTTDSSVAVAGSIGYHLSEQFSVELFGGYFNPTESDTTEELLGLDLITESAKLTQLIWSAGAGVQWSPIYGKLQLFDLSLGNFAFYLAGGFAVGESRTRCIGGNRLDPNVFGPEARCPVNQDPDVVVYEPNTFRPMGNFGVGLRVRFNNLLGMKAEVRDYIFTSRVYRPDEQGLTDSVRNNLFFQIGATILLGGESN